jgi:EmrB/QacA subfamily drug resistance transporter
MTVSQISDAATRPDGRTMAVYFSVLIAMFMATLDMNIVVTALPTIAGELGGLNLFGWVGAAYLLVTAAVSPFYGKLGDMYGRKPVLITAILLFLLGSLACGLAWSMETLIAARILQGLGGGGLMVTAFAVIGDLFTPRQRARYQGYSSAVFALSSILGPVAGGYITSFLGWRWVFFVNMPIGIIVLALLFVVMRGRVGGRSHKVDYAGGVLLAIATTTIVYWCDHLLDPAGFSTLTIALPITAIVAIVVFVSVERRAAEPILPLRLFANRTVTLTVVFSVLAGTSSLGLFFYLALYLQVLTGLNPANVGIMFMPSSIVAMLTSMVIGTVIARTGRYKLYPVLSGLIGAAATLSFLTISPATPYWLITLMMTVFGVSLGLSMQVMVIAVQNAALKQDIGVATGLVTQSRMIGASLGLALNGAVMVAGMTHQQQALSPASAAALQPGTLATASPHEIAALPAALRETILTHYSTGFGWVFLLVSGVFCLATLIALALPNVQIPVQAKTAPEEPAREDVPIGRPIAAHE